MKKMIALAAVAVASLFLFAPTSAEAQSYRSKVIGKCGGCGGNIYSYYRPVRLSCGSIRYTWVPSYHATCRNRATTYSQYRRYSPSPFVSSRYRGFVSRGSGFSISFGSSRGYCR
ncbi:MAG: hypothetical protein AAGF67_17905 [Verrucomicrobiota bacterium]